MDEKDEQLLHETRELLVLYRKKCDFKKLYLACSKGNDFRDMPFREGEYSQHGINPDYLGPGPTPLKVDKEHNKVYFKVPKIQRVSSRLLPSLMYYQDKDIEGNPYATEASRLERKKEAFKDYAPLTYKTPVKNYFYDGRTIGAFLAGVWAVVIFIICCINGRDLAWVQALNFFHAPSYEKGGTGNRSVLFDLAEVGVNFVLAFVGFFILITLAAALLDGGNRKKQKAEVDAYNAELAQAIKDSEPILEENYVVFDSNFKKQADMATALEQTQHLALSSEKAFKEKAETSHIFPAYSGDPVALSRFVDYLDSGRCLTFFGPGGCYDTYEYEKRMDTIVTKLDDIDKKLDQIITNQVVLGKMMVAIKNDMNFFGDSIHASLSQANYQQGQIVKNQQALVDKIQAIDERDYLTNPFR